MKQHFKKSIRDVKTLLGADIDSDHPTSSRSANKIKSNQKNWEEETKMKFGTNQQQRKPCERSDGAKIQSNRRSNW